MIGELEEGALRTGGINLMLDVSRVPGDPGFFIKTSGASRHPAHQTPTVVDAPVLTHSPAWSFDKFLPARWLRPRFHFVAQSDRVAFGADVELLAIRGRGQHVIRLE